jgi:hypothetical protein
MAGPRHRHRRDRFCPSGRRGIMRFCFPPSICWLCNACVPHHPDCHGRDVAMDPGQAPNAGLEGGPWVRHWLGCGKNILGKQRLLEESLLQESLSIRGWRPPVGILIHGLASILAAWQSVQPATESRFCECALHQPFKMIIHSLSHAACSILEHGISEQSNGKVHFRS